MQQAEMLDARRMKMMRMMREQQGQGIPGASSNVPPLLTPLGTQIGKLDFTRNAASMYAAQLELRRTPSEPNAPAPAEEAEPRAVPVLGIPEEMIAAAATEDELTLEQKAQMEAMLAQQAEAQEQARAAALAKRYRLLVLAGWWPEVVQFLHEEAGEEASAIFHHTVSKLVESQAELSPEEIIELARTAPASPSMDVAELLGKLLASARSRLDSLQPIVDALRIGIEHFGPSAEDDRRRAAILLISAGLAKDAEPFLPALDEARASRDAASLDMHAAYQHALMRELKGRAARDALNLAWDHSRQAIEFSGDDDEAVRRSAMNRQLSLLDRLDQPVVRSWLDDLFSDDSPLAWLALSELEQAVQQTRVMSAALAQPRAEAITRQSLVAESLARAIIRGDERWKPALDAISATLIAEANDTRRRNRSREQVYIPAKDLAPAMPGSVWLDAVDAGKSRSLRYFGVVILGRAGEIDRALDLIGSLAVSDAEQTTRLCDELLLAWGQWANPDPERPADDDQYRYMRQMQYYNMGSYYNPYGYPPPQTIPLTRARQQRNMRQLHDLIARIESLHPDYEGYDARAAAFAKAHSIAEVYRLEDIQALFGSPEDIPAGVASSLSSTMRSALASSWRQVKLQRRAGTKRTKPQVTKEVIRGYGLAVDLATHALDLDPDNWRHAMTVASLAFDHSEFLYGQEAKLSLYAASRDLAFRHYASACGLYRAALDGGEDDATMQPYFGWFSAALGASELGSLTRIDQPDESQVALIGAAIDELGDRRDVHIEMLAHRLENSVGRLNPELKPRYVTQAIALLGDHDAAAPLRDLLAYYDDLTDEVRLALALDGPSSVSLEPFGLRIDIHSTKAVSRESGGFSKYLRNEIRDWSTGAEVNYRDDFEKSIRESLADRFEIHSIVFHEPEVESFPHPRSGWDVHPLAYAVVSVKDASVDRLPTVQLDMDFADGSGRVILPIASSEALIDATEDALMAPARELVIEQVLDDREIDSGALSIEIIARGEGVIPPLEQLVDLSSLDRFVIRERTDHGINIAELTVDEEGTVAKTERSWLLRLSIPDSASGPIDSLSFPATIDDGAEMIYQRFADADIIEASAIVTLSPTNPVARWLIITAPIVALGFIAVGIVIWIRRRRTSDIAPPSSSFPHNLTPVTAFSFLRRVPAQAVHPLTRDEELALERDLDWLEESYFAAHSSAPPNGDLERRARRWYDRAIDTN